MKRNDDFENHETDPVKAAEREAVLNNDPGRKFTPDQIATKKRVDAEMRHQRNPIPAKKPR